MAEDIDPKQKNVIKDYISVVEKDQEMSDLEHKVITELGKGDVQLRQLVDDIQLLLDENKELREYINAADNVKEVIKNSESGKNLFRVKRGFECFNKQSYFNRLIYSTKDQRESLEQVEYENFVCKMLDLAKLSIEDSEYNLKELLDCEALKTIHYLIKRFPRCAQKVLQSSVFLLHQISEASQGRKKIMEYATDKRCLIDALFELAKELDSISKIVLGCLNNLSLENRFCVEYFKETENVVLQIIDRFVSQPLDLSKETFLLSLASCLSTIANLARVKDVRKQLIQNRQIWEIAVQVFARCVTVCSDENIKIIISAGLGLLLNMLHESSEYGKTYSPLLAPFLCTLLSSQDSVEVLQRTVGLLRLSMSYSQETINLICSAKMYEIMLKLVKKSLDELTMSYAVKCLALCVLNNDNARKHVVERGMMTLHLLLKSKNEVTIGNSALILGSCFEQKEACEQFLGTTIVKDLLSTASNTKLTKDAKHNAAVALAKLVKNDLRFLDELRELRGLEILHSVIKSNEA